MSTNLARHKGNPRSAEPLDEPLPSGLRAALSAAPTDMAEKIDPHAWDIVKTSPPADKTTVIVTLRDQANLIALGDTDRPRRQEQVIRALQSKARAAQPGLRTWLETKRAEGRVGQVVYFQIVNNSWDSSSPGCDPTFQIDLQALRSAGIMPIFAAGNTASYGRPRDNSQ